MTDLVGMLNHFRSSYYGLYVLLNAFCYLAGAIMCVMGIAGFRSIGDDRGRGLPKNAFWTLAIGAALMCAPELMRTVTMTMFNTAGSTNPLDYEQGTGGSGHLVAAKEFIQLVGAFGFIRGLFMLREVGMHGNRGQASFTRACIFLGSGVLAVNIVMTLQVLANTFGFALIRSWLEGMS